MKTTARYLTLLFGVGYNKEATLSELIDGRVDGFAKKVIYDNLSRMCIVVVDNNTKVNML